VTSCSNGRAWIAIACMIAAGCTPDSPKEPVDDGSIVDDDPNDCDPLQQTGCEGGARCTWIIGEGGAGSTACAPGGTVGTGGACTHDADGVDDCEGGNICTFGKCTAICDVDAASGDCACLRLGGWFADRDDVGACVPECDPVAQDCVDGDDACYLVAGEPTFTVCHPLREDAGFQGDACFYAVGGCGVGFGCLVPDNEAATMRCGAYCPLGEGGALCASFVGSGFGCVPLATIGVNGYEDLGVCMDCAVAMELGEGC
jgi:hypothetical protein